MVAALVIGSAVVTLPSAQADPAPTIPEVERKITTLREEAEQASERYNETREAVAAVNVKLRAAQQRHAQQVVRVEAAQRLLGQIAAETYRRGQVSTLSLVLSDDPTAVLEQAGVVPTLAGRQSGAVRDLREGEARLKADEESIATQQAALATAEKKLAQEKSTVESKLAQAQAELSRLQAEARAQLERASRDRERAALTAVLGAGRSAGSCQEAGVAVSSSTRIQAVLDVACAQLGKPYVWGAEGPGSYDCSGLTMTAWAAAGVGLPHSSAMQARYGSTVSVGELRPGDLVFWHSPISHVAIYLGNGLMIEAPNSNSVVRITPLRGGITTAVRL